MLDGNKLGEEIWQKLTASAKENSSEEPEPDPTKENWKKVGQAIVDHFKANGTVLPGIACSGSATTDSGIIQ